MVNGRHDRVECILGQGLVILGGGLGGARITEDAAGFVRDLCLPIIEEFLDSWSTASTAVWTVVHDIGVATRTRHTVEGEVGRDTLVAGAWDVVLPRGSGPCRRLKARLEELGYPPPASKAV